MPSTKVEKKDKVLKPYFLNLTLVAIFGPLAIKTLLPYCFSGILYFVNYRTQVNIN